MTPDPLILAALRGDLPAACVRPDGTVRGGRPLPAAVLPGSFNPLHRGHVELAAAAPGPGHAIHIYVREVP